MFATMMARIEEEASLALVSVEVPDNLENSEQLVVEEPDESLMQFQHPDAASPVDQTIDDSEGQDDQDSHQANGRQTTASQAPQKGGLIYHGSRTAPPAPSKSPAPLVKGDLDKVGRNDPCPCGSGKKFKKCHGALLQEEDEAPQI